MHGFPIPSQNHREDEPMNRTRGTTLRCNCTIHTEESSDSCRLPGIVRFLLKRGGDVICTGVILTVDDAAGIVSMDRPFANYAGWQRGNGTGHLRSSRMLGLMWMGGGVFDDSAPALAAS